MPSSMCCSPAYTRTRAVCAHTMRPSLHLPIYLPTYVCMPYIHMYTYIDIDICTRVVAHTLPHRGAERTAHVLSSPARVPRAKARTRASSRSLMPGMRLPRSASNRRRIVKREEWRKREREREAGRNAGHDARRNGPRFFTIERHFDQRDLLTKLN